VRERVTEQITSSIAENTIAAPDGLPAGPA